MGEIKTPKNKFGINGEHRVQSKKSLLGKRKFQEPISQPNTNRLLIKSQEFKKSDFDIMSRNDLQSIHTNSDISEDLQKLLSRDELT